MINISLYIISYFLGIQVSSPSLITIGFLEADWVDVLDIFLVSYLLFKVYKLLQGSVASRVFLGLLFIYLLYLVVKAFEMKLMTSILGQFIGVGVIATIILFQQEIRKFLLIIGKTSLISAILGKGFSWTKEMGEYDLSAVLDACTYMAQHKIGALIVFAKSSELKFYAETGNQIDAILNKNLILSIFSKNSPLHDGAVIIANGRIKAAKCILPISDDQDIPAHLGLRHRSALGISEITDCVVLVVSEEMGKISVAHNGALYTQLSNEELAEKIHFFLFEEEAIKEN